MLTSYTLMQFIIVNLTLFLNWKASTIRRSPVPALKAAALLLTFALISLAIPGSSQAPNPQSGENCVNNIAMWETSTASLNVTPCVADSTQIISGEAYYVQLANLTWKGNPNTIDLAFKFPILMSNSGLDLWQNTSHPRLVSNCTSSQQQFNNATNSSLYNITTTTCNPYTNQDFYFDWVNKNSLITHVEHATGQYYALQGVTAATNQLFQARMLFAKKDVGFGNVWKWSLFGKLNSDSISTAISTSRYSELDPAVNATAFNITSQSDTNTSVADFAPFADGKFLMGAGNRSNITGFDSWGDLNYNVDPDWKAYALREGAGTCPLNISAATASLFMETTDTGASTCTIEAIRSVNVSVPKEAGIIISWLQNKSAASLNFEAGMCFVYDSVITNDTTGRCNGGNDMFFITSDNVDNFLYGKGGVPTEGFGTSGMATQHFQVSLNASHVRACVSGVCSALGALATTNVIDSGYVVLMIYNNLGGPAAANFFNISIANATQFGQPLNYTPARFETVLMNDTAVVDKIKITNTTYKTAGAQATFFAMDNNSQNQQSITEGSFADITDFNGLKINGTFTPQNINTTSEITSILIELSSITNTAPAAPIWDRPANNSFFNNSQITFNITVIDAESDAITLYWFVNDQFNTTTSTNLTILKFNDGNYSMRVSAYDGTVFGSNGTLLNFTVDTIPPAIIFVANTPATNLRTSNTSFFINTSENDAGNDHNELSAFIDFNRSLVGYWRFEDDGDTNASDFTSNNNNLTLYGLQCTTVNCNLTGGVSGIGSGFTSAGKRGKGLVFDGVGTYAEVNTGATFNWTTLNWTVEAWALAMPNSADTYRGIFTNRLGIVGSNNWVTLGTYAGGINPLYVEMGSGGVGNDSIQTQINPAGQGWKHYVLTRSGENVSLYIDGAFYNSTLKPHFNSSNKFTIGKWTGASQIWNGSIDEVKLWSRALSAQEVSASFQAGTYRLSNTFTSLSDGNYSYQAYAVDASGNMNTTNSRNFTIDLTAPLINNGSNSDNTSKFLNRNNAFINYTFSESYNDTFYILNGTGGITTNTTPNAFNTYFSTNFTNLTDSNYTFSGWINDTVGNANATKNISITVDTTPPNITLEAGHDKNNSAVRRNWITVNLSIAELYNASLTINLTNSSQGVFTAQLGLNTTPSTNLFNFTGLADGRYNLSINATDKAGNENFTANYTFLIDTTPPVVENGSISPTTAVFGNPFTVYVNISEANIFSVTVTIAGANYTMTQSSSGSNQYNVTFTSTNLVGQYVVTDFFINDTAGNDYHNVTTITFTATGTQQSQGTPIGGGGGGGGLVTVITANGTIQLVLNGTFAAKPAAIERYDAYFPSGDGKKTWQFKAEANAPVKACVTTGQFYCTIGGESKTEVTIKRDYQLSGLANTYEGTVTLLSETGNNAYKIPVKFTAVNFGVTLPINVPGLHVLPSALAWRKPDMDGSAQPRIWPLLLLASSSSLPFVNKAITRRKIKKSKR